MKKTLVLGASTRPDRYSYIAIKRLTGANIDTVAVGRRKGQACGITIFDEPMPFKDIHTVTLYLNPRNQEPYFDYIASLQPKRVIFNPGTENPKLYSFLESKGIEVEVACTLVMISVNNY
ncbi:CoA-binding protein [Robertkochia marina]|uniref:CoA-binding protein n=1 Tax=Robertkochia marina TaxID=1227945 RepID=A0A4S3LY25_9FLAO|nr:CoA-binding protein [Robertkochia marina]THD65677.1 CoA-binding protein [Robertkochia marina]TRZ46639.1 CoA-binding protein [Robertkochia marina]